MKRVFYFSGHRLTVFHWSGKSLSGACSFEPNSDGYEKFREYLLSSAKSSTAMLLDVIEEDFRKEVIPHVFGKDRKAVISRLIDRYYRASRQYTYAEVQGRLKSGRKDDEVLIGAITNPALIKPWLDIIEECDVPLSGIWSLPLVSKDVLSAIGAKKGPVLLVSQQVNSNLRQTFFIDGKMISSRQSVINQDAANITNIGRLAKPEVDRTLTFMRNQHQVDDDEVIHVHIIGSDSQLDSLAESFEPDPTHDFQIHRIKDVHDKLGIKGLPDKFSDGVFSWLTVNKFSAKSHYGETKEFTRFYHSVLSSALYATSVVVVLAALLMTESNISEGMSLKRSTDLLKQESTEFKRVYKEKYEAYEELFSNAGLMDTAVTLVRQIETSSDNTPMDFMVELSKIISQPHLGMVYIDKIEWTTRQIDSGKAKKKSRKKQVATIAYKETNPASSDNIQHVAVVSGRIPVASDNYRESVNHINNIISVIGENERVEDVSAISLPVEVRSSKKFASESKTSLPGEATTTKENTGAFSLRVIMKAAENA